MTTINLNHLQDAAIIEVMDIITSNKFASFVRINEVIDVHLDDVVNPAYNNSKTAIFNALYSMTFKAANGLGIRYE